MSNFGMIKSVAGAVLCGVGVTFGIAASSFYGNSAWLIGAGLVVVGFVVAAAPLPKRRPR